MPVSEYKAQKRGGRGVTGMKQREDDYIDELQTCSSHDNILFIIRHFVVFIIIYISYIIFICSQ